jgi:hypothetical protein
MKFKFAHHIIDTDLPGDCCYAQTAVADLDGDGRPEFIMGQQYGPIYWYKYRAPGDWSRYLLGEDSPSDVGGCALDVDGNGHIDFVAGGAWYRNSQEEGKPFERIVFDAELRGVHDVVAADIDGDGRMEIVTMSDQNSLRWYRIPDDPTQPWPQMEIGPPVHAGVAVGDIDGDGDVDIVRTDVWFENIDGDGTRWVEHAMGPNTPPPPDFQPSFAFDATKAFVCDMNGNGRNDVVLTDAEIPGGKVWWMENMNGEGTAWKRRDIAGGFSDVEGKKVRRGAYHSLAVGDLDGDGDFDILSCEMEAVGGEGDPRWYIWENVDGKGEEWVEHPILNINLGGHEAVIGDFTGNGLPDVISKPWRPQQGNAVDGKMYVVFLENISTK